MPTVRSVERAVGIMGALSAAPGGLSLSDLSRSLGLHKTTALRLLRTLMSLKVVEKDEETDRYRWSPILWLNIARRTREFWYTVDLVAHILEGLARDTGVTAALGMPDLSGRNLPVVSCALPNTPVRVDPRLMPSAPMHALAAGKCYLASLPQAELTAYIDAGLPALTPHTITSRDALLAELEDVRSQGHAVCRQEGLSGAGALGVLIVSGAGRPLGGLGLAAPLELVTEANIQRWLPLLRAAAHEIGSTLAHSLTGRAPRPDQDPASGQGEAGGGVPRNETKLRNSYRVI